MFYSQDILQKRGGKFGIIWIAATRSVQLTKRDYTSVNVRRTCEDIIDYILVRLPAGGAGVPRPRFSLYLSSQLMYGIVRVYSKQNEYFLGEVSTLTSRFHSLMSAASTLKIDIKHAKSDAYINADIAALSTLTGPEFNPEFGVLSCDPQMLDYNFIPDIEILKLEQPSPVIAPFHLTMSPQLKDISLPPSPQEPKHRFTADIGSPLTVPQDRISLREDVSFTEQELKIPGESELQMLDGTDLESLMSGGEDAGRKSTSSKDSAPISFPSHLSPVKEWEEEEPRPQAPPPPEQTTTDILLGEVLPPAEVTPAVIEELVSPPRRQPRPESPGITPISVPSKRKRKDLNLTLELSPLAETPPSSRRRKRQLFFADNETQIPRKLLRDHLATGAQTCKHFELPSKKQKTAKELFGAPHRQALCHPRLIGVWRRNAATRVSEGTDSDQERPVWTVPGLGKDDDSSSTSKEGSPERTRVTALGLSPLREVDETAAGVDVSELAQSVEVARDASLSMDRSKQLADVSAAQISVLSESHDSLDHTAAESRRSSTRQKRSGTKTDSHISSDLDDLGTSLGTALDELVGQALALDPQDPISVEPQAQMASPPRRLSPLLEEGQETLTDARPHPDEKTPSPTTEDQPEKTRERVRSVSFALKSTVTHKDVLRCIRSQTKKTQWTDFQSLAPPSGTACIDAARIFSALLDLCAKNIIEVRQDEPYSDIYVSRGRNW